MAKAFAKDVFPKAVARKDGISHVNMTRVSSVVITRGGLSHRVYSYKGRLYRCSVSNVRTQFEIEDYFVTPLKDGE